MLNNLTSNVKINNEVSRDKNITSLFTIKPMYFALHSYVVRRMFDIPPEEMKEKVETLESILGAHGIEDPTCEEINMAKKFHVESILKKPTEAAMNKAVEILEKMRRELRKAYGTDNHPAIERLYRSIGLIYCKRKMKKETINCFEKLLQCRKALYGEKSTH